MSSRFRFFFFFFSSSLNDFRGSYGGVDAPEFTEVTGMEDIRDLGKGCGCAESLLSSPFGRGVTVVGETRHPKRQKWWVGSV